MKILFVINDIQTEVIVSTTPYLAYRAMKRGHDVYIAGVGEMTYEPDGHISAIARYSNRNFKSSFNYMKSLQDPNAELVKVSSAELDVIFLRNNPTEEGDDRPWAKNAGVVFGQMAMLKGVLVLNHPESLAYAIVDKMYFEQFPEIIRPRSIITRDINEIKEFYREQKRKVVLKPLEGSGGKDVFLVKEDDLNLERIVGSISKSGFVIVQEYLSEASKGDTRLFLMNGKPLEVDGKYCALRRVNSSEDFRSNLHVGAKPDRAEVTDEMLELASLLGPKLQRDGIFLVGLDIVGNKLIELNVMSPGGVGFASRLEDVSFGDAIIEAVERKHAYKQMYGAELDNNLLACLE